MHEDAVSFTLENSVWNSEWLDKISLSPVAIRKKEDISAPWITYDGTDSLYVMPSSEDFSTRKTVKMIYTNTTLLEEKIDEAVDNIAVLLRAAADAKTDPAELRDFIREGLEAAFKGSV